MQPIIRKPKILETFRTTGKDLRNFGQIAHCCKLGEHGTRKGLYLNFILLN